tara:strand:- start:163 stop:816 length:654 start_codon:yes stop_codon:yes gene_type:complete
MKVVIHDPVEVLAENKLYVVRNAVSNETCEHLAKEYLMIKDIVEATSQGPTSDPIMPGAFAMYSPVCFEAMGQSIQPIVEDVLGVQLHQTFSYARVYVKGTNLVRHRDRTSGEWVANVCITRDDVDWKFYIELEGKSHQILLNQGDMIIFRGHKDFHWRPKYTGELQIQAFVSYVDQNGIYADNKYDGRPMLAAPWETASDKIKQEQSMINSSPYYT